MGSIRSALGRAVLIAAAATAALLTMATPAFAPHVAQLQVDPIEVAPGGQVTVWGPRGYAPDSVVQIRFNALDGPVLGTFPTDSQFFAIFHPGVVTLPPDLKPGTYLLFATQELTEKQAYIRGVPARATIRVPTSGVPGPVAGAPVIEPGPDVFPVEQRPAGLIVDEGVELAPLLAVGVGAAALAILAGVVAARLLGRRRTVESTPEPA